MSDRTLLTKLKNHDEQAFNEAYLRYFRLLKHIALRILKTNDDADNVVHDTFLKMMDSLDSYTGKGSFVSWLCSITRNEALNLLEKNKRVSPLDETMEIASTEKGPDQQADDALVYEQIQALVTPEELEILSYRLYCELSFKEIASLTGMTTTACAKKYYAILSHIKKKIKL